MLKEVKMKDWKYESGTKNCNKQPSRFLKYHVKLLEYFF